MILCSAPVEKGAVAILETRAIVTWPVPIVDIRGIPCISIRQES